ncbi:ATP-binding protein [Variovorax sp. J22R24]|uniref:AAA family ATPase n=1 Tax=Variovorax gracilis TaxID=3053502 RepID=UPI002576527D|nr:ATP-binding protein [Variovorax sp. J22R24]MDM0108487.1 ATP-binding protein [Variovorax sp. J22R24]
MLSHAPRTLRSYQQSAGASMAVRRVNKNLWNLEEADPLAVPNARVALALLICVRRSGTAFREANWDDLGAALAPVAQKHARAFKTALQGHSRDQIAAGREPCLQPDAEQALNLNERVLAGLGEGVSRDLPRFRILADKMLKSLQKFVADRTYHGDRNLEMLTRLIGLTPAEARLLRLVTACSHSTIDRSLFAFVDSASRMTRALEALLDVSVSALTRVFGRNSSIARCGLLNATSASRGRIDLDDLLCLSGTGERLMSTPFDDEKAMARSVLTPMPTSTATQLDWPHLHSQRELLKAALSGALERRERGINILLYGAPGTGKTAFVRDLIDELGASAFCVDETDEDGGEATRSERLASLQLSQSFVGQAGRSVIVLDEAEDIFQSDYNHPLAGVFQSKGGSKAWINNLLESNSAPVIWISNRISQLDPAYLRRFSCCLEFPATPYALRRTIAHHRLGALNCNEATIDFASAMPAVTPAHLDAAARFANLGQQTGMDANAAVRFVLESHLKASGKASPAVVPSRSTRFDLRYLNVHGNAAPEAVVRSLERTSGTIGAGTGTALLFSGSPGTGKTQLAAEIATRLGRRLVVRTASDINSKWYGESEGNVARMFRDCDPCTELLFLDEAEILLSAREQSGHRADRAVTAEFLRWLELFQGIFVCATNHASDFDAALMRRFTFRLEFQPLHHQQRVELYAELAHGWRPEVGQDALPVDDAMRRHLEGLEGLTPGDYANAARRIRTLELPASAWLEELQAEHRAKSDGAGQRIGFL